MHGAELVPLGVVTYADEHEVPRTPVHHDLEQGDQLQAEEVAWGDWVPLRELVRRIDGEPWSFVPDSVAVGSGAACWPRIAVSSADPAKGLPDDERSCFASWSKGEQTKAAILDEASELASRLGLGLTIGTLATASKLSKSGLYAHFVEGVARNRGASVRPRPVHRPRHVAV